MEKAVAICFGCSEGSWGTLRLKKEDKYLYSGLCHPFDRLRAASEPKAKNLISLRKRDPSVPSLRSGLRMTKVKKLISHLHKQKIFNLQ
jgi:hypothetical protein